ncbi:hypothetical protein [Catenuloplanes japonicus]|uniref:hypothetical protein n=1 Tax=Catenuloplanes japonicus TaxID=33876 RepID=UPI00068DEA58|nr:hypothetical protein [Catenuloplanes japonicus]
MSPIRAALRQWRHPKAFRIGPPPAPADEMEALLAALEKPAPPESPFDEKLLADAATNLWRAQRRLAHGDGPRDRQTGRYLLVCREALTDAGLVVQDHDGDAYHPGRSLEMLAFRPEAGRTGEVVVETVRPTVYLLDRRIQTGQVIVAGPERSE